MLFDQDQKSAIHLSLAPSVKVWRLLDRLTPQRFERLLAAKRSLPPLSDEQVEGLREAPLREESSTDSTRGLVPGEAIGQRHLPWVPPLVKVSDILHQLSDSLRDNVLLGLHTRLADLVNERLGQRWKFTPEARQEVAASIHFHPELFESFGKRSPPAVAEWVMDKLFFGLEAVASLCEIHPLFDREATGHARLRLRIRPGDAPLLDRYQQLAVVLMSLPPEVTAHLFKNLGPDTVYRVTMTISRLPRLSPETLRRITGDVTGQSLEELVEAARQDGAEITDRLKRYLEGE